MKIKSYQLNINSINKSTPNKIHKAQSYIDSEIIRRSDPLVPFDTGMLKKSGITGTKIGSGVIEYTAPYAKRQYFKGRATGQRGRLWCRRMWTSDKPEILENAQKIINGGKK